jgi:nickel-dependent lactate racemase
MPGLKHYPIDWNGERRVLGIPRDNLVAEIGMTDFPPLPDPWAAIAETLENPIGCPPLAEMLRPGSSVALLTGDRFTDQMLGTRDRLGMKLLDYLNRLGVRDEDVTLVYAPGSHPSPRWRETLGAELFGRVRAIRHDCYDQGALAYLGVTSRCTPLWVNRAVVEADFRLGIGEISPNLQGGWCGGGKIILPGVAGWDSIEQNHSGVLQEVNTVGLADGNPMRLDMEEAARMARLDFKVDVLVDRQARVVDAYGGDFVAAHRAALDRRARDIWMTRIGGTGESRSAPADVYVLYPGEGSEQHLESSFFIRIEGAELGTREDGIVLLVMSAAGGWTRSQSSEHPHWMSPEETSALFRAGTEAIARAIVRREANVRTASILYTARRVLERRRTFLVCDGLSPEEARAYGFAFGTPDFDEALALALQERGRDARIAVNRVDNSYTTPPGRPVAWRAMPWREG